MFSAKARLQPPRCSSFAAPLICGLVLAVLSGCTSLALEHAPSVGVAGEWVRDAGDADPAEAAVDRLLKTLRQKQEQMRRDQGFGGEGGGPDGGDTGGGGASRGGRRRHTDAATPATPATPAEGSAADLGFRDDGGVPELRRELLLFFKPGERLKITVDGDRELITTDAVPEREFEPGRSHTRLEDIGAATVESGWDGDSFVVRSRYTSGATRAERYTPQAKGTRLTVLRSMHDGRIGNLELPSHYHRAVTAQGPATP